MKRFTSLMLMLLVAATTWAQELVQITTDTSNPIYYTIYNTRSDSPGGLLYYAGDDAGLKDGCNVTTLEDKYKFYFTGSDDALYVHNAATTNKLASVGSWTAEGSVWCVIKRNDGDLAFGPKGANQNENVWWNEQNQGRDGYTEWTANDAGSGFVVELASEFTYPEVGKFYTIEAPLFEKVQGVAKGLVANGGNALGWNTVDLANKNYYWTLVKDDETNALYLKNVGTGYYINGDAVRENAAALTTYALGSNQFNIITNGTKLHAAGHNSGNGANGGVTNWDGAANSASAWKFVEREDPDALQVVEVIYNFVYGGKTIATQTAKVVAGEAYPEISLQAPYGVTLVEADLAFMSGTVTGDETIEIGLEVTKELPFETAASANAITTWYLVRMHTNQPGYIGDIAEDNTVNVAWGKSSDVANENYIWGFVGDVFSGITVVNKGTGKKLTSTGSGNVTLTDEGTPFFIAETSETTANATNGFCLRKNDSNQYLNANYSAGKLSHWASTDAGSTFFLSDYVEDVVTVSEAGWATMYLGYQAYIPEDVNVYAVTGVENGWVTKSQLQGVIPANTGVLLENAGEFTFKRAAKDVNALEGNLLNGSVEDTYVEGTAYVLANDSELGVGMYKAKLNKDAEGNDGETHFLNNAGKAYMVLPAASETVAFYGLDWDGTTGINEVTTESGNVKGIYDLTGRRVEAITAPGIYVVNGKKVLVK